MYKLHNEGLFVVRLAVRKRQVPGAFLHKFNPRPKVFVFQGCLHLEADGSEDRIRCPDSGVTRPHKHTHTHTYTHTHTHYVKEIKKTQPTVDSRQARHL